MADFQNGLISGILGVFFERVFAQNYFNPYPSKGFPIDD